MKIAILEYDSRDNLEFINEMIALNKKYCNLYNYDFIFDKFNPDEVHHDWEDLAINGTDKDIFKLKIYYHRYELFKKYIDNYDYLVSFDSDICVNNPLIKIEDLIDNEHDIFIAQDTTLYATTQYILCAAQILYNYLKINNLSYVKSPEQELTRLNVFDRNFITALNTVVTDINRIKVWFYYP